MPCFPTEKKKKEKNNRLNDQFHYSPTYKADKGEETAQNDQELYFYKYELAFIRPKPIYLTAFRKVEWRGWHS